MVSIKFGQLPFVAHIDKKGHRTGKKTKRMEKTDEKQASLDARSRVMTFDSCGVISALSGAAS